MNTNKDALDALEKIANCLRAYNKASQSDMLAGYGNCLRNVLNNMHDEHVQTIRNALQTQAELVEALRGVISVADRKTKEFDFAKKALARSEGRE